MFLLADVVVVSNYIVSCGIGCFLMSYDGEVMMQVTPFIEQSIYDQNFYHTQHH